MNAIDQSILMRRAMQTAISICQIGFATDSCGAGFQQIKEVLTPYKNIERIEKVIALCDVETIFFRFAYLHIETILMEMLRGGD